MDSPQPAKNLEQVDVESTFQDMCNDKLKCVLDKRKSLDVTFESMLKYIETLEDVTQIKPEDPNCPKVSISNPESHHGYYRTICFNISKYLREVLCTLCIIRS